MSYTYHWRTKAGASLTDEEISAGLAFLDDFASSRRYSLDTVLFDQSISLVCAPEWGKAEPVMFGRCPTLSGPVRPAARRTFVDDAGRIGHGQCKTTGSGLAHALVACVLVRLNKEVLADKLDIWGDDGPLE